MKCCVRSCVCVLTIFTVLLVSVAPVSAFSWQEFGDKISQETQKLRRAVGLEGKDSEEGVVCDAGSFRKTKGSMACLACPVGTYVDTKGATECSACPDGKTTLKPGADSVNTCQAPTAAESASEAASDATEK